MDRKDFISKAFQYAVGKGLDLIDAPETLGISRQRPPGALQEGDFQEACTGCDSCMVACPVNVVMVEDLEKRYPVIFPETDPCIQCEDRPCITSCPTTALSDPLQQLRSI